jgi:hypothetical protein
MMLSREARCPACKKTSALRINRNGFLQRKVLGLFGIYPWKCGACGVSFLCRRRGHRHHRELNPDHDAVDSSLNS